MSSYRCDNNVVLPHAAVLSYFRHPNAFNDCDESTQMEQAASKSWDDNKHRIFDDVAQYDFWDVSSAMDSDCEDLSQPARHRVLHSLYDFWGFVCVVILVSCTALLGLDFTLKQYGMGMGLTDCIMERHLSSPPIAHELHFCLASPNREAPGSQVWRLMPSKVHKDCTTEMTTLLVSLSERWKFLSDDEIVLGDRSGPLSEGLPMAKSLESDHVLRREDLGDDVAEEGVLSQFGGEPAR